MSGRHTVRRRREVGGSRIDLQGNVMLPLVLSGSATYSKDMKRRTQGMHWIRDTSRLAIYLRDGMACVYCGASVESGAQLTLDHLKPYSAGGTNEAKNLVTCCQRCNSARGARPVRTFCRAVAAYAGLDAATIERHVRRCARRALPRAEARELIARRGTAALRGA